MFSVAGAGGDGPGVLVARDVSSGKDPHSIISKPHMADM